MSDNVSGSPKPYSYKYRLEPVNVTQKPEEMSQEALQSYINGILGIGKDKASIKNQSDSIFGP